MVVAAVDTSGERKEGSTFSRSSPHSCPAAAVEEDCGGSAIAGGRRMRRRLVQN